MRHTFDVGGERRKVDVEHVIFVRVCEHQEGDGRLSVGRLARKFLKGGGKLDHSTIDL